MGIYTLQSCITLSLSLLSSLPWSCNLDLIVPTSFSTVVRREKVRKEFAYLQRRHRAAATIQSQVKSKIARKQFKSIADASVLIQSGKKGLLLCLLMKGRQSQADFSSLDTELL